MHVDKLDLVVSELRQIGGRHGVTGYNIPRRYFPVNISSHVPVQNRRLPRTTCFP